MTRLPRLILTLIVLAFLSLLLLAIFRSQHNRNIESQWRRLDVASKDKVFEPEMLQNLPSPASRYFMRALEPGKPIASTARLRMKGQLHELETQKSFPLVVSQLLTPQHGFVWEARIRTGIGFVTASDYYVDGTRSSRSHYLGLIPTFSDLTPKNFNDPETTVERMAMDTIFCPASLLPRPGVEWQAVDSSHARVRLTIQKSVVSMLFHIDPEGRLLKIIVEKISPKDATETGKFRSLEVRIASDRTFESTTIPAQFLVRWSEQWITNGKSYSKEYDILELEVAEAWFK